VLIGKCIKFTQDFAKFHVERFMHRLGPGRKEACVYVHGFNNRFVKAAKKMALCGYKMQAESPLFMFSWPSYQVG
jgi:esterase/lipase superfamily enzyme